MYCFIGIHAIVSSALYTLQTTQMGIFFIIWNTAEDNPALLFVNPTSILIRQGL